MTNVALIAFAFAVLAWVTWPIVRISRVAEHPPGTDPRCPDCGPRPEGDAKFCSNCGARTTS
jgi:hypothetical protein